MEIGYDTFNRLCDSLRPGSDLGDHSEVLSLVNQLLDHTTTRVIIKTHQADLPEVILHAVQFVLRAGCLPSS